MKITKRDIKFFLMGFVTMLILDFALNWNEYTTDMKRGFSEGYESARETNKD